MFRRSSRSVRQPAALVLLVLLFAWQSLASAMALPCRLQAQTVSHAGSMHASHEVQQQASAEHSEHCAGMKQSLKSHDCDGLCAAHHCAGVAFALPPTPSESVERSQLRFDASFATEPLRSGSLNELIRPPSRS